MARVGLRERPLLALGPRAESGFGRPFCARHCLSTRRGALLQGLGPDQTFFQDRPTFFLSFARSQPNFRETFAKVACRKGDFPLSTWVEAVKFPNRNGIRAFAQRGSADRGVHRREKHVRTQKCALGCRIRLKPWKFFGRVARAGPLTNFRPPRPQLSRNFARAARAPTFSKTFAKV